MAIRDSLARMLGAKASIIPLPANELPDKGLEKGFDDAALLSTFGDDAWPYILNNKVGEQASQAPIIVGTLKGKEREFTPVGPDHPVQQLFDLPAVELVASLPGARSGRFDGGEFVHLLLLYMGLVGHCPIEIVRPAPGLLIGAAGRRGTRQRDGFELQLIPPYSDLGDWQIVANRDRTIRGYLLSKGNRPDIKFEPSQMTYLRWPNPNDPFYGQGHIQAVRQQVMAEEYASIRDKKLEKQLGIPPGILTSEQPLGTPMAEELQKRWEKAVGGYQNAGRIAVLGSKTTYQAVQQSARDAEWLLTRKDRVEIMAAAVGIPLPLVRMQDAKFANATEARREFWEGTLQVRLNRVARMLTTRLLPLLTSEPLVVQFDYSVIEALGENDVEVADQAVKWADTGVVFANEIRKKLGLPPEVKLDNKLVMPNSASGRQLVTPEEAAAAFAMEQEAARAGIDNTNANTETTRKPPKDPNRPPPAKAKAAAPDREALLSPIQADYKRDLAAFFRTQRNALFNGPLKAEPKDDPLERAIDLITSKRFRDRLRRISEGPIETSLTLGANEAARTLGVGVSFSVPSSELALAQLTGHLERLAAGIENTTVADVQRVLREALGDNLDNPGIRARLDKLFDGYEDWRLDRISRTETTAAYNLGALGQYKDAGVQLVRVSDGDLDAPCAAANGAEWTLEMAEADPISHPNCTRTWIPLL